MARTPAFGLLASAMQLAHRSEQSGRPIAECRAELAAAAAAMSRREFLRVSAYAATGLALGACASRPATTAAEVVVVGAGIAGLSCAYRLRQAGVRVRLFEAQDRVGGRMFSLRDYFPDGQVIELGAELIDTPHTHMRGLAAELGLSLDDFNSEAPLPEAETWYFGGRRYSTEEVATAFVPVAALITRDLATLRDGDIDYRDSQNAEALDALSLGAWLDRNGVSGWLRRLIEVAYTTEMGLDCERQSALNLLTLIGTEAGRFEVFGESDERFHVRGGNDLIVQELGRRLGASLETGALLESLRQDADGGYRLSFARGAASQDVRASHVVLALPFTTLRRVQMAVDLPAQKRRAINELGYGSNAKLMIGFEERPWRTRHGASASAFSDLPFQTSWETTRLQAGRGGVLVNFVGGAHGLAIGAGTPADQAALAVADLDQLYPGLSALRTGQKEARFHWPSNPYVMGSYSCLEPGQWTRLRGAIGEPVGRLYFAGEHCSADNWGFMEGGCETGAAAAAAVLSELDVPAPQTSLVRRLAFA